MERGAAASCSSTELWGDQARKSETKKVTRGLARTASKVGVGLDTVQLDALAGFDEWQDADLRVAIWRGGDQRAVAHLGDESLGGFEVRWIIRARKHLRSLAPTRPA